MLTLLTIIVLGVGGPPGIRPHELVNGNITLSRAGRVVATTTGIGNLSLKLKPGTYTVSATVSAIKCQTRQIKLGRHQQTVKVGCSIP